MASIYLQVSAELGDRPGRLGALIGAERSYHGRAAGFRRQARGALRISAGGTGHGRPGPDFTPGVFRAGRNELEGDASVRQGVMRGIGFVGAGVIFKEGVNVQGLTTAAPPAAGKCGDRGRRMGWGLCISAH